MSFPSPEQDDVPTLRSAMRRLAGAVCLVTTGAGTERAGLTASSVTSLTLEPPCVLVCINRSVSAWPTVERERRFCVNILAESHRDLASRFAGVGGVRGAARFDHGRWISGPHKTPVLADALASVECDLENVVERHSHLIVIGAVRSIRSTSDGTPLLYAQGRYGGFAPI